MQGSQFSVASTLNTNGQTNAPVEINYTVKSGWTQNNFILMTFPKSNLLYQSGASNTPLSLLDGSNHATAVIAIAGVNYSVDTT